MYLVFTNVSEKVSASIFRIEKKSCGFFRNVFNLLSLFWKNKSRFIRSRCCLCVFASVYLPPLSLLGNGSVKIPLSLLGSGSVKIPLSLVDNGSVKIPLSLLGNGSEKIPLLVLGNGSVKNPRIVARQRLGRNVTAVTNTHATIEELLDVSCSMWPVSYQGK
jgi:hypothetical protein